ncbi:hypothetical protein [Gloeothece verrucosa]|uniref:Nucleic acid binding OB-fold tRNA/helicase-type n=1 Tax=Gloeothece verrucosa (strain PCC 7822) TaxID=497965 RepID=E0U8H1_GLOV7|nr:hypothetical protein [Gloeothece verrucosa]ADN13717.1 nucleic acid binding OB-fold tRNA/helicase-type [Gloeothece verrucosa PCC 7822]
MLVKIYLKTSLWQRLSLPFVVGGLIGCSSLANLGNALPFKDYSITPIGEAPKQTQGSTLYLQGKVSQEAPFLAGGAYRLQDHTGSVWVRTNQNLPKPGQALVIKGQVDYQSIPVGNKELGEFYILELEQVDAQYTSQPEPATPAPQPVEPPHSPSAAPPKPVTKPVEHLLLDHKQNQK